uniref:Uncharacterized protein n=1 Tax=Akkesiphycus lubricus TaxID=3022 RepID=A0A8F0F6Z1_AKKLU|nr:hypothetical protein [Akkesiphycus lubricus]
MFLPPSFTLPTPSINGEMAYTPRIIKEVIEEKEIITRLEEDIASDSEEFDSEEGSSEDWEPGSKPTIEEEEVLDSKTKLFYQRNKNKTKANDTKANNKLNQMKVFFIVKSMKVEGKDFMVAIPINNLDDLGNSNYSRAITARTGTFLMKTDADLDKKGLKEGKPGSRPFLLAHALESEGPYDGIPDLPLDKMAFSRDYGLDGKRVKIDPAEEEAMPDESRIRIDTVTDEYGKKGLLYYYLSEYEYDHVFLDNTAFTNVEPYLVAPRNQKNLNRNFKDLLNNVIKLRWEDIWNKEKEEFRLGEIEDIVYKNTDELLSKNIIPVFSSLDDAQDLLLTVLEEILEPYQLIREIESSNNAYSLRNLDYLDDSLTLQNRYTFPETRIDKVTEFLVKYRVIKPITKFNQEYSSNYQQFYFSNLPEGFLEYYDMVLNTVELNETGDLNETDILLFRNSLKLKVVSMGLDDFLTFWNTNEIKNGEALFIPSPKSFTKIKLPLLPKKSKDRFYEYQQRFRSKSSQNIDDYNYTYKISPLSKRPN